MVGTVQVFGRHKHQMETRDLTVVSLPVSSGKDSVFHKQMPTERPWPLLGRQHLPWEGLFLDLMAGIKNSAGLACSSIDAEMGTEGAAG